MLGLAVAMATIAGGPAPVGAQGTRRVGILMTTNPVTAAHIAAALSDELRALGHHEGRDVALEYRWAEGRPDRFPALAADLVRLKVDVIVASSADAADAARRVTASIPIVMVNATDPVGAGLVASLREPGGNVTGLSGQLTPDVRAKQLQILKEALPRTVSVVVLRWAEFAKSPVWNDYAEAAQALGLGLRFADLRAETELDATLTAAARERAVALLVPGDARFFTQRARLAQLALDLRLPGIFSTREYTEAGGLMSYSARLTSQFRRAARYVDRILKGATPATLPIEQPTDFELVVNLKTARALGVTLPQALLIRADEVVR